MDDLPVERLLALALERHHAGDLPGAEAGYLQVLSRVPSHAEAMHFLGIVNASRGELSQAIERLEAATRLRPGYPEAHYNLGKALQDSGQSERAVRAYRQAISQRPGYAKALNNLGVVLQRKGEISQSRQSYDEALSAQPVFPEAHFNRATLLEQQHDLPSAIEGYRTAIAQKPGYVDAQTNLGNALQKAGQFDEAITRLSAIQPPSAISLNALGNALKETGQLDEALSCYHQAADAGGGHWAAANYLYASHFHPAWDARRISDEHREWNRRYAEPLMPSALPHIQASARLRVGFVSPDLREHPVGRFMLPLAENLDQSRFEISYFSDATVGDALQSRIGAVATHWHETSRLSPAELAQFVRSRQIDVLIDLTMHMEGSRLLTFARKPAPVQMTYLAYCSTTGLSAIDYRLSDPYLDPVGLDESIYTEMTLRFQHTYWCYRPPSAETAIANKRDGEVVFGCLNNYCKLSEPTWDAWIRILQDVPNSKLLIFCPEGSHRAIAANRLKLRGVDPQRLSMIARMPRSAYFQTYEQIDIALDPFPYGGGTTTLDALWAGVPVVTLAGQTAVGRGGVSILTNLGMPNWIGQTTDDYVRIAGELAGQRPDRNTLREQLRASPLMDEKRFARDFETTIAGGWQALTGQTV